MKKINKYLILSTTLMIVLTGCDKKANNNDQNNINNNELAGKYTYENILSGSTNTEENNYQCKQYNYLILKTDLTYTYTYGVENCGGGFEAKGKYKVENNKIILSNNNCEENSNCSKVIELDYIKNDNNIIIIHNKIELKKNIEDIEESVIKENNTNKQDNNQNTVENKVTKKGHTIDTSVGKFIVDKDGSVYYIKEQETGVTGTVAELTDKDLSVLGIKQQYKNYTYHNSPECNTEEGCIIEAYKLDLTNISSTYEVYLGNAVVGPTIIFLSYDGKVHELNFNLFVQKDKVQLTKNVSEYPNIVSIVPNMSFGGHGAMLIDKDGNKYNYNG